MTFRPSLAPGRRPRSAVAPVKEARVISLADARRRRAMAPSTEQSGAPAPTKVLMFPGSRRAGQAAAEASIGSVAGPRTILLVDDSATSLLWQRMILKDDPYTLITASSAEQAVVLAACQRPDLVIMDADMPGAGGLSGCRSLRDAEATRHVPIVLLALRSAMPQAQRAVERGLCNAALAKPIERDALLREVRSRLA
jgi:CheY-like chemotaxis protein